MRPSCRPGSSDGNPRSAAAGRGLPVVLLAATVLLWILTGSFAAAIAGVALLVFADRLVLGAGGRLSAEELEMEVSLDPAGGRGAALSPGGVAELTVRLARRGEAPPPRGTVTPLVPPGAVEEGARERPTRAGELVFRYRVEHVGVLVFPGVLLRRYSPLGLFREARFVPGRAEIPVLPEISSAADPTLARFLRAALAAERPRPRALRGAGTDFAEIRHYRPSDTLRRVDWKATARRSRLLVRDYEEPREFTIRVVLDGSADLGPLEFARAADLTGKLAAVALSQSMGLTLTVYAEQILLTRRLSGVNPGLRHLLADLVALPRYALLRAAAKRPETAELAERAYRSSVRRFGGPRRRGEFLDLYLGDGRANRDAAFLADFRPDLLSSGEAACPDCGDLVFDDEAECAGCGRSTGVGRLTARAACLVSLLDGILGTSRGREMLVLVSSYAGGEFAPEVTARLTHAATGYRRVHVLLPAWGSLVDDRAEMPKTMGAYPERDRTLRDMDTLARAEQFRAVVRNLTSAGVNVVPLDDPLAVEGIVTDLLLKEVGL